MYLSTEINVCSEQDRLSSVKCNHIVRVEAAQRRYENIKETGTNQIDR